jgi:rare lipoprotein A
MIRRASPFALLAALLPALMAHGMAAHAQERTRSAWATNWATSVYVGSTAARREASNITTSSLTPISAKPKTDTQSRKHDLEGIASYYWQAQKTANGETFDKTAMTAAHRTLPFGTKVRVINIANGTSVLVRINDRGPFKAGRVIDVSDAAAEALRFRDRGLTQVRVEVVAD